MGPCVYITISLPMELLANLPLPFFSPRLSGGKQSIMEKPGGHLHVDVAVATHCQPDSVNNFMSRNEISVDNLFGRNVIGKVTNNG